MAWCKKCEKEYYATENVNRWARVVPVLLTGSVIAGAVSIFMNPPGIMEFLFIALANVLLFLAIMASGMYFVKFFLYKKKGKKK